MKILVVCQYYYPENFVVTKIAEQLASFGHEVDVLTGKPNYGYGYILPEYKKVKEEDINGVHVHRVNLIARKKNRLSIIFNYLSFWANSKKWVRKTKNKYDVVFSMSLSPVTICCAGNLYKKKHHVPHVIHCVDLWPESTVVTHAVKEKSLTYKILYKWSRSIYSKADKILVGSRSFVKYFDETLKLRTDNIFYVPQCSLVEKSEPPYFDYGPGTHILYCGNLGIIQLIPLIVEAMKLVEDKSVYFHIIGMGPMSDYLMNQIEQCGLSKNVIYYGPIIASKAAKYFPNADALYVSLKNDGVVGNTIPNKLTMSMAFARPILAMLKGDGEQVLKESGGAIFAEENAQSLADAIIRLSKLSKEEKDVLGKKNRQYFDDNFSLNIVAKSIEEHLK